MLRAIYEWCTDNGYTPYLAAMVDAQTRVPKEFVEDGEIVLNISFSATSGLKMDNDIIHFSARFGGVSREISVPVANVVAIYARENGQGMAFEVTRPGLHDASATPTRSGEDASSASTAAASSAPTLTAVPSTQSENTTEVDESNNNNNDPEPPKKGGKPTLTRIK